VEVLGIYLDGEDADVVVPRMAMVAVKRLGVVEAGLAEGSEVRLVKELERGLEDLKSFGYKMNEENSGSSAVRSDGEKKMMKLDAGGDVSAEEDAVETSDATEATVGLHDKFVPEVSDDGDVIIDVLSKNTENNGKKKNVPNMENIEIENGGKTKNVHIPENVSKPENIEIDDSVEYISEKELDEENKALYGTDKKDDEDPELLMMEDGVDMTPEELFKDVESFKEEEDKSGFARTALETAKELVSNKQQASVKEASPSDAEDELRQIFAAGERLAESKIVTTRPSPSSPPPLSIIPDINNDDNEDQRAVDELLSKEKQIRPARQLEEELAELEIRVNRDPDATEAPPSRPFDLFSGPEDFVEDPALEVNYPGAGYGEKNVVLAKELKEAVDHATFAARTLEIMTQEVGEDGVTRYYVNKKELSQKQVANMNKIVTEAAEIGLIPDPVKLQADRNKLDILLAELSSQPTERYQQITDEYRDLLLSDNFVPIVKTILSQKTLTDPKTKANLTRLIQSASLLLKEAQALGAELETMQLEVIRSICSVAMSPQHQTQEAQAQALTDKVKELRPLLDETFVAYLKYAVAEEEAKLARRGLLHDPEANSWLFVLKIIREGVYAELAKSVNRYLEHIWYVLRMPTKKERRLLLQKLVDDMPSMDVRPFVRVVDDIVASLGQTVKGEFDNGDVLGGMTVELMQLKRDLKDILPQERINEMARAADDWMEEKRQMIQDQRDETRRRSQEKKERQKLMGDDEKDIRVVEEESAPW